MGLLGISLHSTTDPNVSTSLYFTLDQFTFVLKLNRGDFQGSSPLYAGWLYTPPAFAGGSRPLTYDFYMVILDVAEENGTGSFIP